MNAQKDADLTEVYPGIFRITLPLPGTKPGPVNVYLFKGGTVTLMDTGTMQTAPDLIEAINRSGLDAVDISQVVFTHGHVDHCGGAKHILDSTDKSIATMAHADDAGMIERGYDATGGMVNRFLRITGLPFRYRAVMFILTRYMTSMGSPCPVTGIIRDNDLIQLGHYTARVIHTPGHTKGSVSFFIEKEKILFAGDSVLPHITPNAFVMLEPGNSFPARMSQFEFFKSIERIESLRPSMVFPAHGEVIKDLESITSIYRGSYSERDEVILSLLGDNEYSVYDLAMMIFKSQLGSGRRFLLQMYLALSEVYTHLQVLEKNNKIRMILRNNVLAVSKITEKN